MPATFLEQLQGITRDYGQLVLLLLAIGGALFAVLLKWPAKLWAWWKRRRESRPVRRETPPTETIRAVLEHVRGYAGPEWSHATRGEERGMDVYARWTFTNIVRAPIKLVGAFLDLHPRVHGAVLVKNPRADDHGNYALVPGLPTPGSTHFTIFPTIRKPGQDLKATVVLVDNLGNEHRTHVVFRGPKSRRP